VVAFTRHDDKVAQIRDLGADEVVVSSDDEQMQAAMQSIDLMVNTIPVAHDIAPYLTLMKPNGTLVVVGNMIEFKAFSPGPLVFNGINLAGSLIGGIQQTQEILDLCAEHDIKPSVKMIGIDELNDVFEELSNASQSDFRHVIDMQSFVKSDAVTNEQAKAIEAPIA